LVVVGPESDEEDKANVESTNADGNGNAEDDLGAKDDLGANPAGGDIIVEESVAQAVEASSKSDHEQVGSAGPSRKYFDLLMLARIIMAINL
jgi:hypothetical protein